MHDFIFKTLLTTLIATSVAACSSEPPTVDGGITTDASTTADAPLSVDAGIAADGGTDAGTSPSTCIDLSGAAAIAEWTEIDATPGCYFFSGPTRTAAFHLGARARIGGRSTLWFDGISEFEANETGYQRDLACNDDAWTVRERFDGTWSEWPETPGCDSRPTFRGTYTYTECSTGPDGTCTPTADDCSVTATIAIRVVTEAELPARPTVTATASEIMATCAASCAAEAAVMSSTNPDQPCEVPNPACVDDCVAEVAGACGPEAYALQSCYATEPTARFCFDPIGRVVTDSSGPCQDALDAFSECDVNPEICVVRR